MQLVVDAPIGPDGGSIKEGFVYTKLLRKDAYVRASELEAIVSSDLTPAELEESDLESIQQIASRVTLTPTPYPWMSCDGALSALLVSTGDSSIMAEWNTEHPHAWQGLDTLQAELQRLFAKYR